MCIRDRPRILCSNIQSVSELCPNGFRTSLMHSTLHSVATIQNGIWIMLQKILLSKPALRVLPSPNFREYITRVPRNSASTLNQWTPVVHRPGPDRRPLDIIHMRTLTEVHSCQILFPSIRINILDDLQKPSYARSRYPTQLAKMSFDEILDLAADVF